jgi:hypothetical protein
MAMTSTNPTTRTSRVPARGGARAGTGGAGSVAVQVREQRRNYARAVVRSLARLHRGQPVAQVQRQLRSALTPLGVRLSPVALRELAAGISAGTPVELP